MNEYAWQRMRMRFFNRTNSQQSRVEQKDGRKREEEEEKQH